MRAHRLSKLIETKDKGVHLAFRATSLLIVDLSLRIVSLLLVIPIIVLLLLVIPIKVSIFYYPYKCVAAFSFPYKGVAAFSHPL